MPRPLVARVLLSKRPYMDGTSEQIGNIGERGRSEGLDLAILYRLIPAFLFGAGAGVYGFGQIALLLLAAALAGILALSRLRPAKFGPWLALSLLASLVAAVGVLRARAAEVPAPSPALANLFGKSLRLRARIVERGRALSWGTSSVAEILEIEGEFEKAPPGGRGTRRGSGSPAPGSLRGTRVLVQVVGEKNAWIYLPGAELRFFGRLEAPSDYENPGVHTFGDYLASRGVYALVRVSSVRGARVLQWPRGWQARLARHGDRFARWVSETAGEDGALVTALTVGNRSGIGRELSEAFRSTGTSHILSISGIHIGMAGAFFFFIIRALLLRWTWLALRVPVRKVAVTAALLGVWAYAALSGNSDSALRAALMFGAAVGAALAERSLDGLRAILLAAFLLVAADPFSLAGISFQLSFAATGGLILALEAAAPYLARLREAAAKKESCPRRWALLGTAWALGILAGSLAANLATWPLIALYFNRLSLGGFAANLFVIPWAELVLLPLSVVSLGLWSLWSTAALPLVFLAAAAGKILAEAVLACARWFPLEIFLAAPAPIEQLLYFGALLCLGLAAARGMRWAWRPGLALAGAYLLALAVPQMLPEAEDLSVEVLDAGSAQVTLARWPGGQVALLDRSLALGEARYVERAVWPALLAAGAREPDLLVFAARGSGAARALSVYERLVSPKLLWRVPESGPPDALAWPAGGDPLLEILLKDAGIQGAGAGAGGGAARGWAAVLRANSGQYVLDGAPGRWPSAWPERWRRGATALELSHWAAARPAGRWIVGRAAPQALVLSGSRRLQVAQESLPGAGAVVRGGWARLDFKGDRIHVEQREDSPRRPRSPRREE